MVSALAVVERSALALAAEGPAADSVAEVLPASAVRSIVDGLVEVSRLSIPLSRCSLMTASRRESSPSGSAQAAPARAAK